ncbi:SMI1/KNR4 family protein [Flavobacterium artemisiae]|uniref:SMI1/KNR4 family protein n=1 Tax=Flavobacterium artemisiae TaxID=2126556 RepID=A0ABW4HKQ5_9FLAO
MRKLTLYPRMGDSNMRHIENIIGTKLPEDFKDFLKTNGGLSHYERYFIAIDKTMWEVNRYLAYQDLFKLTEEFLESYKRKLVPFAFDMGGWHFCLCLDEGSDYGSIVINRWSDYLPEEQFIKITESFEDFINGLKTEEELN